MNRKEAEQSIRDLLVEIAKISKEYGTKDYLALSIITSDGYVQFNNRYWDETEYCEQGEDFDHPLNYREFDIDF